MLVRGKIFTALVLITAAVLLFAGCGGGGELGSIEGFDGWTGETSRIRIEASAGADGYMLEQSENLIFKDASDTTTGSGGTGDGIDSIYDTALAECVFFLGNSDTTESGYVPVRMVQEGESCTDMGYSQNNCIECDISARGEICFVSCLGTVPSNATIASDSIKLIFEAYGSFTTTMPASDGVVRIDGLLNSWPYYDPQADLSYNIDNCDNNDLTGDNTTELGIDLLSDPNGDNSESFSAWNHTYNITSLGNGSCELIAHLEEEYSFTGAEDGSTFALDITGGSIIVDMQICDTTNCGPPVHSWAKSYGGANHDEGMSDAAATSDGGYITSGFRDSTGPGVALPWLVKLDRFGGVEWEKTYGVSDGSLVSGVVQVADGGYVAAGYFGGSGYEGEDFMIFKVDSSGVLQWDRGYTYAGGNNENVDAMIATSDGGFATIGNTDSIGAGGNDFYFVKFDAAGAVEFSRAIGVAGGTNGDRGRGLVQTSDDGYLLVGETDSYGADGDAWAVKLNSSGTIVWQNRYGDGYNNVFHAAIEDADDGDYVVAGYTYDESTTASGWVVKLDSSNGAIIWQYDYGDNLSSVAYDIIEMSDNSYLFVGGTHSFGAGDSEAWVANLNSDGTMAWQKAYGDTNADRFYSVQEVSDGSLIMHGQTKSFGVGVSDFWTIHAASDGTINSCSIVSSDAAGETSTSVSAIATAASFDGTLPTEHSGFALTEAETSSTVGTQCE